MSGASISFRAFRAAPAPSTSLAARASFALREAAPRVASLLPGVWCRGPERVHDGSPAAYLTFDDGPDPAGTPPLLRSLELASARATFFVLGSRAAADPGLIRAIADAGHSLGSHGWRHVDAWRQRGALDDLRRGTEWLQDFLGSALAGVRPPYGRLTPAVYRWARHSDHRLVLWDAMPGDFGSADVATLARRVASRRRPGSIIVLHDGRPAHRAAALVDAVVPALQGAGWHFPALPPC